eukprot:gene34318-biopygen25284
MPSRPTWTSGLCRGDLEAEGCPAADLVPLGLESGDIPNSQITSAVGGACAVTDIRLNSGAAWCSGTNVAGDWAQVDLGAIVNVGVIGTQARKGGSHVEDFLMEADDPLSPSSEREFFTQERGANCGSRVAEVLGGMAVQSWGRLVTGVHAGMAGRTEGWLGNGNV